MGVFQSIGSFFSKLWNGGIKEDFNIVVNAAEAFFSAAVSAVASELGTSGLQIVTDAVLAVSATSGTGAEKLAAAQAKIATDLAAIKSTAPQHVINVAIEAAVAQLNAKSAS